MPMYRVKKGSYELYYHLKKRKNQMIFQLKILLVPVLMPNECPVFFLLNLYHGSNYFKSVQWGVPGRPSAITALR